MLIHTALISHRHGTDFFVARTEDGIYSQVAAYCREWWSEAFPGEQAPDPELHDDEIVSSYFDANSQAGENVDIGTAELADEQPTESQNDEK